MQIRPINTEASYRAALREIESLMAAKKGSPEGARSIEDLVNPVQTTDHRLKILGPKSLLFHPKLDGLNGVRQSEREVLRLI